MLNRIPNSYMPSYFSNLLQTQSLQNNLAANVWTNNNMTNTFQQNDMNEMLIMMMLMNSDKKSSNSSDDLSQILLLSSIMGGGNMDIMSILPYLQQTQTNETSDKTRTTVRNTNKRKYNADFGSELANSAKTVIWENGSRKGRCASYVAEAFRKLGLVNGNAQGDGWEWADKLASRNDFKELEVDPDDLPDLPAGAVVVWNKSKKSPYGHVSISDGKGNEYSDHKTEQLTNLRGETKFRVFIPT